MKLTTGWLKPPSTSKGIDHLGTQAPCGMIYGQLLPGITNVTDRARYYSFYPWLVWSYDQRYSKDDPAHFVERFRRADCLFTLIAERHSQVDDQDDERHGIAMVGRNKLVTALTRLKAVGVLLLSQYATTDTKEDRYFVNRLGGLSQYYAGTLANLMIMQSSTTSWTKYSTEYGSLLAQDFETNVAGTLFWEKVEGDEITLTDLDELSGFCACNMPSCPAECQHLTDIFFDVKVRYGDEGEQRRRSLALIQQLASALPDGEDLSEEVYRACAYTGVLPGGLPWTIPPILQSTCALWVVYVRNDLLSVAFQTILSICLTELQPRTSDERGRFGSIEAFADWFVGSEKMDEVLNELEYETFSDLVEHASVLGPALADWGDMGHEIQLGKQLIADWRGGAEVPLLLARSLELLAMLVARNDLTKQPYSGLVITADSLRDYPINLVSFRHRAADWQTMSVGQVASDLMLWCMNTHLRVALRKLRQSGRSTFQLHPSELGVEVACVHVPAPTQTTPRFRQAVRILRDLGLLTREGGRTRLTDPGRRLMEVASV
ncbi:hypothetical protein JRG42_12190 [Pseudomonas granadensis]|uniref:hypothetical protein n=1 Tax=Pseudomonas granadensis TaxID=1421430 RepID=UPI0019D1458F|nr:hypothetical protein [Pseudomonas granadensis]MBN6774269.1 hypothetical protein [Pseudomonas granadensis]MBN6805257.1 hypothetical protein [Pseudomonas granadensis]MBN6832295.1 hypothetical protein [Pseudomonas granadensis]MBN6839451.1 hypothetical protein [Pseudomonas granadensis]MBN6868718.1 hypothetical protein [Pseudomonas granadensis]